MVLDPGLGLMMMVLTAPSSNAPSKLDEPSAPVQFDPAAQTRVDPAPIRALRSLDWLMVQSEKGPRGSSEILQLLWTPMPRALLKIDPAGLRFNFQF